MDPLWSNFSPADQARMRSALRVSELPNADQLSQTQLQKLDKTFGYRISVQILVYEALSKQDTRTTGTPGEPRLAEPQLGDASDLAAILASLQEKLGRLQIGTAREGVKISKQKLEELSKQRLDKIKEMTAKMEKANTTGTITKILGWVGASVALAVSLVALAAAIAFTGGTAAVFAGIGVGLALAGIGLMILQETPAMEKIMDFCSESPMAAIALTALFGVPLGIVLGILAETKVLDKDQIQMALQVGITLNMLALSIATMVLSCGASTGSAAGQMTGLAVKLFGDSVKVAGQTVVNASKIVSLAGGLFGGLNAIAGGSASIAGSIQSYEVVTARAESKEFLAWMAKFQARLEEEQEALKKAIEALQNDMVTAAQMLSSIHESKEAVIGRMGTA